MLNADGYWGLRVLASSKCSTSALSWHQAAKRRPSRRDCKPQQWCSLPTARTAPFHRAPQQKLHERFKISFSFFFSLFCKPVWLHWTGAMCLLHPAFFVFLKLPLPAISAAFHFLKSLVQTTPSGVCQWHQASFTLTLDRV